MPMSPTDIHVHYPRRIAAPLVGAPGIQITRETLGATIADPQLHIRTIQILSDLFRPDIIWPIMDLTLEAGALGAPVRFDEHAPPSVSGHPVKNAEDLRSIANVDVLSDPRIRATLTTVDRTAKTLTLPVGGYVIGPFTLAGQLMGVTEAAMATLDDPEFVKGVVEVCYNAIERYAESLAAVGADPIVVLEPSAVMLSPSQFDEFSAPAIRRLVERVPAMLILHVCGNSAHLVDRMAATGVGGLSLDACLDFPALAERVSRNTILVGNIDPVHTMVDESPEVIRQTVWNLLERMMPYDNFVLSTACDLPPETPLANIHAFMATRREWNLRQLGSVPRSSRDIAVGC